MMTEIYTHGCRKLVAKPSFGKKVLAALARAHGFTLIETILAISILSVVIVTAGGLATSSIRIGGENIRQFSAFHLAEEGVEVVRHLRDSNWLQNRPWTYELKDGTYTIRGGRPWHLEAFSNRSEGAALPPPFENFTRVIELKTEGDTLHVQSRVSYQNAGKEKSVTLNTELTDWK